VEVSWEDFTVALGKYLQMSTRSLKDFVDIIHEKLPEATSNQRLPDNPPPIALKTATTKVLREFGERSEATRKMAETELNRRKIIHRVYCLRQLLVNEGGRVHIADFGKICDTLGPLSSPSGQTDLLERVASMMRHKWFYGYCSSDEAFDKLKHKEVGTFLVRFSAHQSGFVISRVVLSRTGDRKEVIHTRVNYEPGRGLSLPGRKGVWPNIEELVRGESSILKTPAEAEK
jgi:hypothetical protein